MLCVAGTRSDRVQCGMSSVGAKLVDPQGHLKPMVQAAVCSAVLFAASHCYGQGWVTCVSLHFHHMRDANVRRTE